MNVAVLPTANKFWVLRFASCVLGTKGESQNDLMAVSNMFFQKPLHCCSIFLGILVKSKTA